MNKRDTELFKHLLNLYKKQWDRNQYYRENHDDCTKYYKGYRNETDYPLAYNESFNKVLPILYTLLSRFMEQIFQTSNVASVAPRKSRNLQSAQRVEGLLNFQLENLNCSDQQGGAYLTFLKWFISTIGWGKGIAKAYWKKDERISPRRIPIQVPSFDRFGNFQGMDTVDKVSQEMQIYYDAPYVEILHNKLCVPDPRYKSIDQMPAFFCVYGKTIDYIKQKVDEGAYRRKALRELSFNPTNYASQEPRDSIEAYIKSLEMSGGVWFEDERFDLKTGEIDILECYTKAILKNEPYNVGSGMQIKGREEEVIVHIGNYKTILSLQRNLYGKRPLFDMGCYYDPELYWDIGLIQLTKGIQEQYNNLGNLRLQNIMMHINTMIRVDPESDVPHEALVWKPFGIVPAETGEVEVLATPDFNSNIFIEQEKFLEETIQDMMGMYAYNMGQTPQRQERTGVVYGIQSMGEARAKLMLLTMDYLGMRPLLKYFMLLNTFHLPSGSEYRISKGAQNTFGKMFAGDIHPDYDFMARYTAMEPALGKQARAQQLLQLAPVMQQNPFIEQYQWIKTVLELSDVREAEVLLKDPRQVQQEMQMAQQRAMQGEVLKARLETEGKIMYNRAQTQGDMAENQQKFEHDVVLEALRGEVKKDEATAKRIGQAVSGER